MSYFISRARAIENLSQDINWWFNSVYYGFLLFFAVAYWFGIVGMKKVVNTAASLEMVWMVLATIVVYKLGKKKKLLQASTDELVEIEH